MGRETESSTELQPLGERENERAERDGQCKGCEPELGSLCLCSRFFEAAEESQKVLSADIRTSPSACKPKSTTTIFITKSGFEPFFGPQQGWLMSLRIKPVRCLNINLTLATLEGGGGEVNYWQGGG